MHHGPGRYGALRGRAAPACHLRHRAVPTHRSAPALSSGSRPYPLGIPGPGGCSAPRRSGLDVDRAVQGYVGGRVTRGTGHAVE